MARCQAGGGGGLVRCWTLCGARGGSRGNDPPSWTTTHRGAGCLGLLRPLHMCRRWCGASLRTLVEVVHEAHGDYVCVQGPLGAQSCCGAGCRGGGVHAWVRGQRGERGGALGEAEVRGGCLEVRGRGHRGQLLLQGRQLALHGLRGVDHRQ